MSLEIVLENQNFDRENMISKFVVHPYRVLEFKRIQELGKSTKTPEL